MKRSETKTKAFGWDISVVVGVCVGVVIGMLVNAFWKPNEY
jgi:F0F1-type ATP synthase assembly protein I